MQKTKSKFVHRLLVTLSSFFISLSALSNITDDTEIFLTMSSGESANPNVVYILDNSGSMNSQLIVPLTEYNKDVPTPHPYIVNIYNDEGEVTGTQITAKPFNDDSLYLAPYSSGADTNSLRPVGEMSEIRNNINTCAAFNYSDGFLNAAFTVLITHQRGNKINLRWRQARTELLPTNSTGGGFVAIECANDTSKHGKTATSAEKYPIAGNIKAIIANTGPAADNTDIDDFWTATSSNKLQSGWFRQGTLFTGHYLNWKRYGGPGIETTRIQVAKDTLVNLLQATETITEANGTTKVVYKSRNQKVGLMLFNYWHGGYIRVEAKTIGEAPPANAHRTALINEFNAVTANNWTPVGETLYEALRYFKGLSTRFHYWAPNGFRNSIADKSPITSACQKNHIVLLTDGAPTYDWGIQNEITSFFNQNKASNSNRNYACSTNSDYNTYISDTYPHSYRQYYYSCLDELALFAKNEDFYGDTDDGESNINIHTIAFNLGNVAARLLLEQTAINGGGGSYSANDNAELNAALSEIVSTVNSADTASAAPSVPISTTTRFSNGNKAYMALFKPFASETWEGNLKSYFLQDVVIGSKTVVKMVDVDGKLAVDEQTSLINSAAKSRWSTRTDGQDVTIGGVRSKLNSKRTLYISKIAGIQNSTITNLDPIENETDFNNVSINALNVEGATTSAQIAKREEVLKWALNYEVSQKRSKFIADPLHAVPLVLRYADNGIKEQVVYGTNQGMLHFVNEADDQGTEDAIWMPEELLGNITRYYNNERLVFGDKPYGLDGDMKLFHIDANRDRLIDSTETALLIVGMRRGGHNIYAIDVSTKSRPSLAWRITPETSGFKGLGQTWSKMKLGRIKFDGVATPALFFTGGYDAAQDTQASGEYNMQDSKGRSLYVVNALTGEKIWSAGFRNVHNYTDKRFKSSIVASPALLDENLNSFIDNVVVLDVAGRVARFQINEAATSANNFLLTTDNLFVADLSAENSENATGVFRRHYFSDPVASFSKVGKETKLNIVFGSGRRPNPRSRSDQIQDRFYILRHPKQTVDKTIELIKDDKLVPVVLDSNQSYTQLNTKPNGSDSFSEDQLATITEFGAYLDLGTTADSSGEKVLGKPSIVQDSVVFATYTPENIQNIENCSASGLGSNTLYSLKLSTASKAQKFNILQQGIFGDVNVLTYKGRPVINVPVYDEDHNTTAMLSTEEGSPDCSNFAVCVNSQKSSFTRFWLERAL